MKKVVSFLASGRGSNLKAVAESIVKGDIDAHLGIVLCDNPLAKALDLARQFGIPGVVVDPGRFPDRKSHEEAMIEILEECKTDLVVAAGYMRLLTPHFIGAFRNRIINIHPALLPSFPGVHAQEKAFNYGVKISGCTAHFIDEGTDTGPIILQKAVPVMDDDTADTLAARILREEHKILPEAVRLFCKNRLRIEGRKVIVV